MPKQKKCSCNNHSLPKAQVYVRHCTECGEVVNKDAHIVSKCSQFHFEKSQNGYKHCPDCGEKL